MQCNVCIASAVNLLQHVVRQVHCNSVLRYPCCCCPAATATPAVAAATAAATATTTAPGLTDAKYDEFFKVCYERMPQDGLRPAVDNGVVRIPEQPADKPAGKCTGGRDHENSWNGDVRGSQPAAYCAGCQPVIVWLQSNA